MQKGQLIYFVSDEFGVIRMKVERIENSDSAKTGSRYDKILFTELDMPLADINKDIGVGYFHRHFINRLYIESATETFAMPDRVFFDEEKALNKAKVVMDILVKNAQAVLSDCLKNQAALSQAKGW